ncbi:hypothetical protein BH09MYX1_BH09MYX1_14660 [soil metagenome]
MRYDVRREADESLPLVTTSISRSVGALVLAACVGCAAAANEPASPTTSAVTTAPSEPGATAAPTNAILAEHNRLRERHCAPPLTWSPRLEKSAKAWADHLRASGCNLEHSAGNTGENLAAGSIGAFDGTSVVRYWYDESAHYAFAKGGFSSTTGHFTQVVWSSTREVGCGQSQCNGMDIWVCQYDPPGNFQGEYGANVKPTTCR